MRRFQEDEYRLPFFKEYGYDRKLCPRCGEYFWTQDPDQTLCGEAGSEGCADYTFINDPPTRRSYSLQEMREAFLTFFEKRGHKRIKPYPLIARWRDDLYFTNASIIDFQPYVTEGMIPPPANPLVISQPCVRFVDVDNTGPTFGRHYTIFEMGGHHAFNYTDKEVYWKDETVRYHHEFVTEELGVNSEEVIYKEGVWSGGGNAGPDVESVIRGLEVATLVFMKYKVVNGEYVELPIRTVDTGYGLDSRFTWLSQGSISGFHAVYGDLLGKIMDMSGIEAVDEKLLSKVSKVSGLISISKTYSRIENWRKIAEKIGIDQEELHRIIDPIVNIFAVTDHTKCVAFLLAEGVVPSNVREGYLTRLMIRRTYRLLKNLSIENKLPEIIDMQIAYWSRDFPYLKEMQDEILEILSVEQSKFEQTLTRGRSLIKKIASELKRKGIAKIDTETLTELYDSHGLPPEIVKEVAEKEGVEVRIPDNFYSFVAERHVESPRTLESTPKVEVMEELSDLPSTRMLYYEDPYTSEFEAEVIRVLNGNRVILDRTAFYPEGGGQPADRGYLEFNGTQSRVIDVQKAGNIIIHFLEATVPKEGYNIRGVVDWDRRINLMRNHTGTHMLMGAARRVLGKHVWQAGAQKDVERSRLDITHYRRLTAEEIHEIEGLANDAVMRNMPVETMWMPREEAERLYGFRLYQGGVVPGREIRVVKSGDWEVEACGGTHCSRTGEVGLIKVFHTERIQDGVERIIFSTGLPAVRAVQKNEAYLLKVAELLEVPVEKVRITVERLLLDWRNLRRENELLMDRIAKIMAEEYLKTAKEILDVKIITRIVEDADVDQLIKVADNLIKIDPKVTVALFTVDKSARVVVMVGKEALKIGIKANEIAGEVAAILGGGGSGRPDFAQGGGTLIEKTSEALQKVEMIIRRKLGG